MKKRIMVAMLLALLAISLFSNVLQLFNTAFLTLKRESMIQWGQEDEVRISVRDMSMPYISYRRILGLPLRSRGAIGADFTALLLEADGLYPDKESEASSDRTIQMEFAEKAPKQIVVYEYVINNYGMDQNPFFMKNGGAVKTKYALDKNSGNKAFQFALQSRPAFYMSSSPALNEYRGVRILCKFDGCTIEYTVAFRTGVPVDHNALEAEIFSPDA